ncbi:MAG: EamA family transporter [Clostridiales bacterium]|nr:EamA family transporter [Clostridiales bacterium]
MMLAGFIALTAVAIGSLSQLLLKTSASRSFSSVIKEYLNWRVLSAYGLLFITTILNSFASKSLPVTIMTAIDALGYVFVLLLSYFVLKEKMNKKKLIGIAFIVSGVFVFSLL